MKELIILLLCIYSFNIYSQNKEKALKFFPQTTLKIGSQTPHIGCQLDIAAGVLLKDKYFLGIGGGYSSNMGMGGKTFPLYADCRYFFASKENILFKSKDDINDLMAEIQLGMSINNNEPYKTGFIAACGIAYRFDFIKINKFNFPSFYLGPNIEYSFTKFEDEYRGYKIQNGHLKQLILNLKIAFDINPINLN
jgi:hypothetical protein